MVDINEFLAEYSDSLVLATNIVIILITGYILGKIANKAIISFGRKTLKDKKFGALRIGPGFNFGEDMLELFSNLLKYIIYLASLVVVFDQLQFGVMRDMLVSLWYYTPNIIAAFVIVIAGVMLGELLGKLIRISLVRAGLDELFKEAGHIFLPSRLFAVVVRYFMYLLAFTMALTQLGFQTLLLTIIVGSAAIILTMFVFVLVTFGLKNMMPDMLAGMYLRSSGYIKLGEKVQVDKYSGKVKNISLMSVTIEDNKGIMKVPNSVFLKGTRIHGKHVNKQHL